MNKMGSLERVARYRYLLNRGIKGLAFGRAVSQLGALSDLSYKLKQTEGLRRSIAESEGLMDRSGQTPVELARLRYVTANSWEKLRLLKVERREIDVWDWEQEEIEQELVHLRRALNREAVQGMTTEQICRILTNIATLLNHVGRVPDALEYWDRSLQFMPSYSMARGKRGYALTHYAQILHDQGHSGIFLKKARTDLESAASGQVTPGAKKYFQKRLEWVAGNGPKGREFALFEYADEGSNEEVAYRKWCLGHRLFLNPINDLGGYPAAMNDVLNVPGVILGAGSGVYCQGIFNQMKQAYASARYMYYEGVTMDEAHFSDRGVLLYDTGDNPVYALSAEKIKAAYTMAYGVFDKMAYFLNHYMGLGIEERELSFRSMWYRDGRRDSGLRDIFAQRRNWPLRGLFWMSKDLFEDSEGFRESIAPDAKEIHDINRGIGSKYLKLHEDTFAGLSAGEDLKGRGPIVDSLAYSIHRSKFEAKTLRLLKLVRSSLVCFCHAMHIEERHRARSLGPDAAELPAVVFQQWLDAWKV